MAKYIKFGKWNKQFKYIFLTILFILLNDYLNGFNYENIFLTMKIFDFEGLNSNFSSHKIIHQFFSYIGLLIIAICFYKYENKIKYKKYEPKKENPIESDISSNSSSKKIILIHNEDFGEIDNSKIFYICILTIFIWVTTDQILILYGLTFKDLDFWMFEIVILSYITSKMFKIEIYNHQILALILNVFPVIFKIATIIISFKNAKINDVDNSDKISELYIHNNKYLIGIIFYFIPITLRSYVNAKIKWFMDLRYISPNALLIFYGLFGAIISFIICIISTFVKCKEINNEISYVPDINDYICKVNNTNNNGTTITEFYFENFIIYFKEYSKFSNIIFEILKNIFLIIIFFFFKYFYILVIKYLTPVYAIFLNPIYFFFQKIILGLNTLIREGEFFVSQPKKYLIYKFYFDISGDFVSILGYLIYLEIIELKF